MLKNISNYINQSFFSPQYWFSSLPASEFKDVLPIMVFSSILLALSIFAFLFNKLFVGHYPPKNKLFNKLAVFSLLLGFFGIFVGLFRYQGIMFFSARFFQLLTVFFASLALTYVFFDYRTSLPREVAKYESYLLKRKYLPKKKKKR